MLRVLALCWLLMGVTLAGGLDQYQRFLVADPSGGDAASGRVRPANISDPDGKEAAGVRITYLGTNGYQLEWHGSVLLVDPYFTRASLGRVALQLPLHSETQTVHWALAQMKPKAVGVLVTHGHFDHNLDIPEVMRATGARLVGSATTVKLAELAGAPTGRLRAVQIGQTLRMGPWKVTALEARHDCVFGKEPYPGEVKKNTPPAQASDWKMGVPLAFLIEVGGKRIYVDSGGRLDGPVPRVGKVDLAMAGVALKDSRERLPALLKALRPRYFLPSHQDDFFRPLNRPFRFGQLTDFPQVVRMHSEEHLPGRLILMNYFQPWTLR